MRILETKMVTTKAVLGSLCLMLALAACANKESPGDRARRKNTQAIGLETKTAAELTGGEMCGELTTDENGKSTVDSLTFRESGELVRRTRVLTTQSQLTIESQSRSTWGYLNEQLLITDEGKTIRHDIETFKRESDQANCLRFVSGEAHPEFCACDPGK